MSGRPAKIAIAPFVLRHDEVARDYFRRSPHSFTPSALRREFPSFPLPRHDGLYLREAVEAWVRRSFGIDAGEAGRDADLALQRARHGRRQDQASPRS